MLILHLNPQRCLIFQWVHITIHYLSMVLILLHIQQFNIYYHFIFIYKMSSIKNKSVFLFFKCFLKLITLSNRERLFLLRNWDPEYPLSSVMVEIWPISVSTSSSWEIYLIFFFPLNLVIRGDFFLTYKLVTLGDLPPNLNFFIFIIE